ncbi:MAG TPA: cadmium-translocating P-type ATPase [Gammaproteobacteria bacterium]|nr:cadmium-translocating P-type ATPase [Gammaproteobacteria bacterium]
MNKPDTRETILLSVNGMSCAGCVRTVEAALKDVPGVQIASVNFAGQTAAVTGETLASSLIRAVNDAGYDARLLGQNSIESQENEAVDLLRRSLFRSSLALAGGSLLMADMWFGLLPSFNMTIVWVAIGIATLACMLIAGGHFFRGALSAARHLSTNMDTLIVLGTGSAWIYSMVVILYPELLPIGSRHQFFEAALFVIGFVNLGKALEMNARSRASLAIQKLFDLTPRFVTLIDGDEERLVPVADVEPGQQLRIRPGENFPVDGFVVDGKSSADESLLTGESLAIPLVKGSGVSAGTLNIDGSLLVEAASVGEETRLAAIRRLVNEAQNSKPPVARLVDQITAVFVPVIILIAGLTFMTWWLVGPEPQLSFAFVTAMSVLIIACPCALGLAVPMSIMVGIGRAATNGLLIRNSEVLQVASTLDIVVLDKTGTLTMGEPEVNTIDGLNAQGLSIVLGLEQQSAHPVAKSIVSVCLGRHITAAEVSSITEYPGGGVVAEFLGDELVLGSLNFLKQRRISGVPEVERIGTVVALAVGSAYVGHFVLSDKVREGARETIQSLLALGVTPVMLTGDRSAIAEVVAEQVGITEIHAEVSPEKKLALIQAFQAAGHKVAMVGDGINDAAALSAADVGFAMGLGSDVALESADVTLRNGSLQGIEQMIRLSRKVLSNVRQNLVAAFGYNILLIPVAAGVLYPFFGLLINPAFAGLAMALSSVTVVFNAGRLRFS